MIDFNIDIVMGRLHLSIESNQRIRLSVLGWFVDSNLIPSRYPNWWPWSECKCGAEPRHNKSLPELSIFILNKRFEVGR